MKKIVVILSVISIISCNKDKPPVSGTATPDTTVVQDKDSLYAAPRSVQDSVAVRNAINQMNQGIIKALKNGDYQKLATYIHPEKGVRFSMYAHVDTVKDKRFSRAEFVKFIPAKTKFTFGAKDGTGELYVTPLAEYIRNWVYKRNFAEAELFYNRFRGTGNSLNNLPEVYPNAFFTENFIPGTDQYGGMDWNALRLVFESYHGTWYLVAVINDEWTV